VGCKVNETSSRSSPKVTLRITITDDQGSAVALRSDLGCWKISIPQRATDLFMLLMS
jgi:hypothetical protein